MRRLVVVWGLALFAGVLANLSRAAADRVDVAAIIDKAEAESILGEPVRTPRPRSMNGSDGYYSKCTYYSATSTKSLVLRLRQPTAQNVDVKSELADITAGAEVKPVEGLGDSACMLKGGAHSALPDNVLMLYVIKGNSLVTIGLGGISNESLALEKVKFVARKIVARL